MQTFARPNQLRFEIELSAFETNSRRWCTLNADMTVPASSEYFNYPRFSVLKTRGERYRRGTQRAT
jgi:hypothetical protein